MSTHSLLERILPKLAVGSKFDARNRWIGMPRRIFPHQEGTSHGGDHGGFCCAEQLHQSHCSALRMRACEVERGLYQSACRCFWHSEVGRKEAMAG